MKYLVIQKIKALGLQVGDVFISNGDGTFSREYNRVAGEVRIPKIILDTHPEWFEKHSLLSLYQISEAIKKVQKTYTSSSSKNALKKLVNLLEEL